MLALGRSLGLELLTSFRASTEHRDFLWRVLSCPKKLTPFISRLPQNTG